MARRKAPRCVSKKVRPFRCIKPVTIKACRVSGASAWGQRRSIYRVTIGGKKWGFQHARSGSRAIKLVAGLYAALRCG